MRIKLNGDIFVFQTYGVSLYTNFGILLSAGNSSNSLSRSKSSGLLCTPAGESINNFLMCQGYFIAQRPTVNPPTEWPAKINCVIYPIATLHFSSHSTKNFSPSSWPFICSLGLLLPPMPKISISIKWYLSANGLMTFQNIIPEPPYP